MLAGGNTYFRVIGVMVPRSSVTDGSEMADGTLLGVGNCVLARSSNGKCFFGFV